MQRGKDLKGTESLHDLPIHSACTKFRNEKLEQGTSCFIMRCMLPWVLLSWKGGIKIILISKKINKNNFPKGDLQKQMRKFTTPTFGEKFGWEDFWKHHFFKDFLKDQKPSCKWQNIQSLSQWKKKKTYSSRVSPLKQGEDPFFLPFLCSLQLSRDRILQLWETKLGPFS